MAPILMRPGQLPRQEQLDMVTPLKAYYAGQQNTRRNEIADQENKRRNDLAVQQGQMNQQTIQQNDMKLKDYPEQQKRMKRQQALQDKLKNVEVAEAVSKYSTEVFLTQPIDTTSKEYQQQYINAVVTSEKHLIEKDIFTEEEGHAWSERAIETMPPPEEFEQKLIDAGKRPGPEKLTAAQEKFNYVLANGTKAEIMEAAGGGGSSLLDKGLVEVDGQLLNISDPDNITVAHKGDGDDEQELYEKKIQTVMDTHKINKEQATGLVLGTTKMSKHPVTGKVSIVDMVNSTESSTTKIDGEPKIQPEAQQPPAPGKSMWALSELVAGPASAARQGLSVASGMVGGPIAEKTVEARQYVVSAKNDLIRALSINPRFPVGEIDRIKEEISLEPKVFDNPKMFRARMKSINRYLKGRLEKESAVASNTSLPAKQRQEAFASSTNIEEFIRIMGVPPSMEKGMTDPQKMAIWGPLKLGDEYFNVNGELTVKSQ